MIEAVILRSGLFKFEKLIVNQMLRHLNGFDSREWFGEEMGVLHFSKTWDADIWQCPSDVIAGQVQHSKVCRVLRLEKRRRECAVEVVVAAIPDSKLMSSV